MQQVTIIPGTRGPECDTHHSHPSKAEVKNEWNRASPALYALPTAPFSAKWHQSTAPKCHSGSRSTVPASQHSHVPCHVYRMIRKRSSYGNYKHFWFEAMRIVRAVDCATARTCTCFRAITQPRIRRHKHCLSRSRQGHVLGTTSPKY
jgi:hypothetical protein